MGLGGNVLLNMVNFAGAPDVPGTPRTLTTLSLHLECPPQSLHSPLTPLGQLRLQP